VRPESQAERSCLLLYFFALLTWNKAAVRTQYSRAEHCVNHAGHLAAGSSEPVSFEAFVFSGNSCRSIALGMAAFGR